MERAARYRVNFTADDGTVDAVNVWASSPRAAMEIARTWLDEAHEYPAIRRAQQRVARIGDSPEQSDLGIATTHEAVDHLRRAADGARLSTLFRVQRDELRRNTDRLRREQGRGWQRLRQRLHDNGLGLDEVVVASLIIDAEGEPSEARVVSRDCRWQWFFAGRHPLIENGLPVLSISGDMAFEDGPAWFEMGAIDESDRVARAALELLNDPDELDLSDET